LSAQQLEKPKKKRGWPKGKPRPYLRTKTGETEETKKLGKLERLLNILKGKVDPKSNLRLLLDPDKVESSTRLSANQVDFVSLSVFVAREFPEFEPLAEYAFDFCLANISLRGEGRQEAIRLMSAMSESKILSKMGFFKTQEAQPTTQGKV